MTTISKFHSYFITITLFYAVFLFKSGNAQLNQTCPPYACPKVICDLKQKNVQNFCDSVKCVGIQVTDCTKDEEDAGTGRIMYDEHLTMCGCCPGCVKYLGVGEPCEQYPPPPIPDPNCTHQFCPILMNECAPGLECPLVGINEKKCSFKSTTNGFVDLTSCHDKRALAYSGDLHWTPQCEIDGSYSPKQCKGSYSNGICFCASKDGTRIFGTEYQNKAQNQTCACSRQVHELRESGHIASFHCTQDGNYEPLQCDTESGLCYCVEPKTGRMTGAVLPENQWKRLPCYSVNLTNFNPELGYYRICESEWAIAQKLSIEASLHGLKVLSGRRITCDFDGSYAAVQNMEDRTKCVNKNGVQMADYSAQEESLVTNCQCIRDEVKSWADGIPFQKRCARPTGNYDTISPVDKTLPLHWQCVDQDGMFFGDKEMMDTGIEDQYKCCLFGPRDPIRNCISEPLEIQEQCYDPSLDDVANTGRIKPCDYYPT